MHFAMNRALAQRVQDERLGRVKHKIHEIGHSQESPKILWRKNIVMLNIKVLYKLSGTSQHVYDGEALDVKHVVEQLVRGWLEQKGFEDSD